MYRVIGVDLPTKSGLDRIKAINSGEFPFLINDDLILSEMEKIKSNGNLSATFNEEAYQEADIIIVDIHLDIPYEKEVPLLDLVEFKNAISVLGQNVKPGAIIIVETTVPPGTCNKIVKPALSIELRKRNLDPDCIFLAHSYERVMPGQNYLNSIVNFWRVFAVDDVRSSKIVRDFFSSFINTYDFPLIELSSMLASETAKVLENTYRAANIAFIDEWTKYSEAVGIDLFEILDAIKVRPTHSNIRQPGLGVGGYCLTKDPAFVPAALNQIFKLPELDFPFSKLTIQTNNAMPLHTLKRLAGFFGGELCNKNVLVCGISYRQDIGDTRYSPSQKFVEGLIERRAHVDVHDPYVAYWQELKINVFLNCLKLRAMML